MNATVTNNHHFSKGVTLTIKDGKSFWSVDNKEQKYKYGTIRTQNDTDTVILNPNNSLDDFVKLINLVFEFTGTLTDYEEYDPVHYNIPNNLKIKSDDNYNQWTILKHIYNTKLEHHPRFVRLGHCGCNMGNCGEVTGFERDNNEYETYGDLMKLFGYGTIKDADGNAYYSYPDSVLLCIERIKELPKKIHNGNSCLSEEIDINEELDKNEIYLSWCYGR